MMFIASQISIQFVNGNYKISYFSYEKVKLGLKKWSYLSSSILVSYVSIPIYSIYLLIIIIIMVYCKTLQGGSPKAKIFCNYIEIDNTF